MQTFADLQEAFFKRIDGMMVGYQEGHVIFDCYLDQSLKDKTCKKRAATSREFEIHPEMKLTMSLKELLSAPRTKKSLTTMLAEHLLQRYSSQCAVRLTVVYHTKIKGHDFEETHSHEEADTIIAHQVMVCSAEAGWCEIRVW